MTDPSEQSVEGLGVLERRGYDQFVKVDSGGQARVYKTLKNNKVFAVKVIKIKSKNNAEKEGKMEEDLRREISVMKNLKHTNCLMVRDLFRTVHKVYIVMDFMPNGSVGSYVRKYDGINEWQAKSWFCPIARAVRYLHESLVAHRDIKLDNILLDRHWNPMLTDFGFSRFVSMDTNTREAQKSDTFCGTPSYNPPEMVRKTLYDPLKADVWTLGVSLFIMINRDYPFDKSDRKKMLDNQMNRKYALRPYVDKAITDDLKDLLSRLLEPNFVKRMDVHRVCSHPWFPIDSIDPNLMDTDRD